METLQILKKQGGVELLKRYAKAGVLPTAILEFLILGRKRTALEILRLAARYKTLKRLRGRYSNLLDTFNNQYDENRRVSMENYYDNLNEIIKTAKENNIKLFFIVMPVNLPTNGWNTKKTCS